MSVLIYNILLGLYRGGISVASLFNKKAGLWVEGRKNYFAALQKRMYKNTAPVLWFHCASLGEFEQARPLIERIREEYPGYNLFVTFFSPSGYEIRKNYDKADYVFYLPLDTSFNARKFVRVVNPKMAFFVKYEFWHHYLNELHHKKIPVISFSAIFRENQMFFKPYGGFFRGILKKFDRIFVQDEHSVNLLRSIGVTQVEQAGDTRFDRVRAIVDKRKSIPLAEAFKSGKKVLVAGSVWEKDMTVLLPLINLPLDVKIIIAPHEIHESSIRTMMQSIRRKVVRYSMANETDIHSYNVLIVDNIGMLSSLYQYGEFAYVGGAFGKGLHNILEAATFGLPVFFGPNYGKFKEAEDLVALGAAIPVKDETEMTSRFNQLFIDDAERKTLGAKARTYVESNTGATDKILNFCKQYLS